MFFFLFAILSLPQSSSYPLLLLLIFTLRDCIYLLASGGSAPHCLFHANKSTSSLTGLQLTLTTGHLGWEQEGGRQGGRRREGIKAKDSYKGHCRSLRWNEIENQASYTWSGKLYHNLCLPHVFCVQRGYDIQSFIPLQRVFHQMQPPPVCIAARERNAEQLDFDIEPSLCLFSTCIMPAPSLHIVSTTRGGFLSGLFVIDMERGQTSRS